MKVTASCKFNDHDLTDIPVLNPDGWFGKTWLLELGGCYTPLFLVVEADINVRRHRRTERQRDLRSPDSRAGRRPGRLPRGRQAL